MSRQTIAIIFFSYGLAFFSMGLAVMLEVGRGSDQRLRRALRPLAAFGFLHGFHEWTEMFELLGLLPGQSIAPLAWISFRISLLAFSFLSLAAFGSMLLARGVRSQRLVLLVPVGLSFIWGLGAMILRGRVPLPAELWDAADVWTRYSLALPGAVLAASGLVAQQRVFRRAGMAQFGRDSLWAAVAFIWYGLIGQVFTKPSLLPPSNVINQELFLRWFGFPVQLLRAIAAIMAAWFIIRTLRSFEVETRRKIAALQQERLEEAEHREALRGELLKRVVAAQEGERQRIGRELHDEAGQALTAIGLGVRAAATNLRQDVDKAAENLRQVEGLVVHSIDELQRLIADLRPSHLDDLGLDSALRWYAGEVSSRSGLQISVEIAGELTELAPEVKIGLFRIAQEALTNILKHADAQHAKVRLTYAPEAVQLEVEDDGCGFDLQSVRMGVARPSWGLTGMEERAHLLRGQFQIHSEEGGGTKVVVRVPIIQQEIGRDHDSIDAG